MIEVPERVKDALREGNMLKTYRFRISRYVSDFYLESNINMSTTYEAKDNGAIKVVGDDLIQFSLNVTTSDSDDETATTSVISTRGDDGLYYVLLDSVSTGTIINPIGLQSASATVAVYHYKLALKYLFTIDNDTLIKESVKIDDRMCSGGQLKFGLCEGASLEFQYFDHESILGCEIQAFVDVQYVDEDDVTQWHTIPLGYFTVDQCPMQASTGIFKITAYNKLRSSYLDANANVFLDTYFEGRTSVPFYEVRKALCDEYELDITTEQSWSSVRPEVHMISGTQFQVNDPEATTWDSAFTATDGAIAIPQLASFAYSLNINPNDIYELTWLQDDIDAFEDKIYQKIYDQLGYAVSSANRTTLMNAITSTYATDAYLGCYTFFGITLTKEDNTIEIYSKRAKDNNAYGAVGYMGDIINKLLFGYKKITFYVPFAFALTPSQALLVGRTTPYVGIGNRISGSYCNIMSQTPGRYFATFGSTSAIPQWIGVYALFDFYVSGKLTIIDSGMIPYPEFYTYQEINFTNGISFGSNLPPLPVQSNPSANARNAVPLTVNSLLNVIKHDAMNAADTLVVNPSELADITAREAISAVYELSACYGRLSRTTDFFTHLELNGSRLLPADDLYPDNGLYPGGESVRGNASMYQRLWTDSQGVQTFRYLIITYKTTEDGQEVEKTLQRTVNADGTTDYNMSDNWLFRNLVWTASQVGDLADEMADKMRNVSWFPFEMWCAGLPYLEPGDEIEITDKTGTHTSYVLQRQLNGIQNLQDTYIDGELDIF